MPVQHSEPNSKRSILTQNPKIKERKHRIRWFLAFSTIPLFAIITAFGIAPQTIVENVAISTVSEDVSLPKTADSNEDTLSTPQSYWQTDQVRRDDTLTSLLRRLNIKNAEALDYFRYNPEASPLASQLRPGQPIQAQTNENGDLIRLRYQPDANSVFEVTLTKSGYLAQSKNVEIETQQIFKSAEIKNSLFGATDAAEIPDAVAMQLVDIFSGYIDFQTDLRRGDRLLVIYEANYSNGIQVNTGKVIAAELLNGDKTYQALMYKAPDGMINYYSADGKSLHKSFLRSPLEFTRVSSGFSLGRLHPILNTMRAHKGVDFAAPIGTRVKASGDGIVEFAGIKNGYGNVIVLHHSNNINTVYGHLSAFAKNLHHGTKVSQGDVIGYVGMTGLATGPHLHYEFLVNGEHRDPQTVSLPSAVPIASQYLNDFRSQSLATIQKLNLINKSYLASLE